MKAAIYHNKDDIRIEEMPVPTLEEGEILVRMKASGICGTDLMEWYRTKKAPRVLGHEMTGVVCESRSSLFKPGQRVFVSHHVPCNNCKYCNEGNYTACETLHTGNYYPGGFSEYIRVPALNVTAGTFELPDHVGFEEGTLTEPLACAIRAQEQTGIKKSHTVLVAGCGFSGLLNIMLAYKTGAKVIATEMNAYRADLAKKCGAGEVYHPDKLPSIQADRVIVCTDAYSASEQAFRSIERKGTILFFAIPFEAISLPNVDFWRNEWTITSSYGAGPDDLKSALQIISDGSAPIGIIKTRIFPLSEIQAGFKIAAEGDRVLKVIICPD